ncbi:MAG: glycosyltransferase family 87 protein [Candidatus Thorarchaeota archaeon]|jgi:hypothetical protein
MLEMGNPGITKGPSKQVDILMILSAAVNILLALALSVFGSQMYPFFILVYIWIAAYVFFIATLIRRESTSAKPLIQKEVHLVGVIALTILIRSVFLGMSHHISLDSLWYVDFGKFMQMGVVPYTGFYFPYPPVFAYVIFLITSTFQGVEGFRLFAIMMDVGVLIVLWKLVLKEMGSGWASTAAIAYAFLPISVIESGWNGHFEPLANLLLLLALWFLLQQRYRISGAFLGLAVATKIYPLVVFPILFTYIKGWKNRLWFTFSMTLSGFLTFVPIPLLAWTTDIGGAGGTSQSVSTTGLFESLFGFLFTLPFPSDIIAIGIAIAVVLGVIHLMRLINRNDPVLNAKLYRSVTFALGLILIAMGVVAGIYPLLPFSRQVYWRFPIDVGLVRGITTICVGLLILFNANREWTAGLKRHVTPNSLLALVGATSLLFIAMVRQFFYGWYLLWSIPFFLLLRDRRLSYTVILCLLLVYPNYTHDNFASLGFEETRQWHDEFETVGGWSSNVHIIGNKVNVSQVASRVDSDGVNGQFWFDTRNVTNSTYLSNVSFSYTKVVDFDYDETTEFVARIISSWDPPLGRHADLAMSIDGFDATNEPFNGSIITRSSVFTNLTYVLWRYAFMNLASPTNNGTISILTLTIYPVQRVESCYKIDFFYTTYAGLLNPVYFLIIPSLIAIALTAFTILYLEFEREEKINNRYTKVQKILN